MEEDVVERGDGTVVLVDGFLEVLESEDDASFVVGAEAGFKEHDGFFRRWIDGVDDLFEDDRVNFDLAHGAVLDVEESALFVEDLFVLEEDILAFRWSRAGHFWSAALTFVLRWLLFARLFLRWLLFLLLADRYLLAEDCDRLLVWRRVISVGFWRWR